MKDVKLNAIVGIDKEMFDLHDAYDKHEYKLVALAQWHLSKDPVYQCKCGCMAYSNRWDDSQIARRRFTSDESVFWVHRCMKAMDNLGRSALAKNLLRGRLRNRTRKYRLIMKRMAAGEEVLEELEGIITSGEASTLYGKPTAG